MEERVKLEVIFTKIDKIKKKVGKISKDSENPFYKSKYFDINSLLEHLEPLLQEEGLLLLQPIRENQVVSEIIDIESNEGISSSMTLPELTDPQKMGSAVTYYRRYTLASLLALQSEDDDGNLASGNKQVEPATEKQRYLLTSLMMSRKGINISTAEGRVKFLKETGGKKLSELNKKEISSLIDSFNE
jgi:hypothetical protein